MKIMIDILFEILFRALSIFCAANAVFDFSIGVKVHSTEWYLNAICRILFALYLWRIAE